jgi:hypothetical protein
MIGKTKDGFPRGIIVIFKVWMTHGKKTLPGLTPSCLCSFNNAEELT